MTPCFFLFGASSHPYFLHFEEMIFHLYYNQVFNSPSPTDVGGGGIIVVCKKYASRCVHVLLVLPIAIDVWSMALMLYMTAVRFLFEVTFIEGDNFEVLKFIFAPHLQLHSQIHPPHKLTLLPNHQTSLSLLD